MEKQDPSERNEAGRVVAGGELRVLHVVDSLNAGGMENGVVNIARFLDGPVQTFVAGLRERGVFAERLPRPENAFGLGKSGGFSLRVAVKLGREIRERNVDVVHTHNLGPLIYVVVARALGFWRRFPPIAHGEHSILEGDELGWKRRIQRRFLFRFCAVMHTVSGGLMTSLRQHGMTCSREAVILNGVDGKRFHPVDLVRRGELRKRWGLGEDDIVIGIVGRLVARKRHQMLVSVIESIAGEYPALRLLIVGDRGPERDRLRESVDASPLGDRVVWLGFQDEPEHCYQAMDMLAVPSESEGLANVVLEAMACGVPVVGSMACGSSEVVESERTGLLGEISDADDLEALVRQMLAWRQEGKLEEMGRLAREAVCERFSLSGMAEKYLAMYRSVAIGR